MKHSMHHDLGIALARKATRRALETYRANFSEYDPRGAWIDEDHAQVQFTVLGKTLKGTVEVKPSEVLLELDVPLIFRAFRSIAMKVVEDEINQWLDRARRGELD